MDQFRTIYEVKFLYIGSCCDCNCVLVYTAQFVKHFGKYGDIIDSVIMKDRKTGQPRGFGFVTYAEPSVVDKVIEDTHIINGKQVGVFVYSCRY
jgi:hypothetical protein